jgi:hypothetical protein
MTARAIGSKATRRFTASFHTFITTSSCAIRFVAPSCRDGAPTRVCKLQCDTVAGHHDPQRAEAAAQSHRVGHPHALCMHNTQEPTPPTGSSDGAPKPTTRWSSGAVNYVLHARMYAI